MALFMLPVLLFVLGQLPHWVVHGEPQVPCFFIFGDSLADNGNNNNLNTMAKANYSPYGIDFPKGHTGRFGNGRTVPDIVTEHLEFDDYIPSFTAAISKNDILRGVNYASASAGIHEESGSNLGARISMDNQLQNHQTTVTNIVQILGNDEDSAAKYLSKCIYAVLIGSNDYINNYFLPQHYPASILYNPEQYDNSDILTKFYPTSTLYNPGQYAQVLIEQYTQQLKKLYSYNARKVVLFGLGKLGCVPGEVAIYGTNGSTSFCVDNINNAVQLFNNKLKSLVDDLNTNLRDAKFIYIDSFDMATEAASSPGFTVLNAPCCKIGADGGMCIPMEEPCSNRNEYLFWDAFHPTEALNSIMAARAYNAQSPTDVYPFDIHHLAKL